MRIAEMDRVEANVRARVPGGCRVVRSSRSIRGGKTYKQQLRIEEDSDRPSFVVEVCVDAQIGAHRPGREGRQVRLLQRPPGSVEPLLVRRVWPPRTGQGWFETIAVDAEQALALGRTEWPERVLQVGVLTDDLVGVADLDDDEDDGWEEL